MGPFGDFVDFVDLSVGKVSEVLGLPPKAEPEPEPLLGSTTSDGPHEPYTQANKPSTSSNDLTPLPEVPEIGAADFSGVIGPDFGPYPPVGEDTPPPPGEPGETPPQQPDQLIEFRDVPSGEIPNSMQQPQGIDPNLLDSIVPGPTLDTGLVERIEQSPGLVGRVNQDPSVAEALEREPTQIEQIEQDLSLAEQKPMEPTGDSHPNFMDPGLTEQPLPDPSTPDDGAEDLTL